MNIKAKLSWGLSFLFLIIILIGALSIYYLSAISADAKNIIKDNYESLGFMHRMVESMDSLDNYPIPAMQTMERNLKEQESLSLIHI